MWELDGTELKPERAPRRAVKEGGGANERERKFMS